MKIKNKLLIGLTSIILSSGFACKEDSKSSHYPPRISWENDFKTKKGINVDAPLWIQEKDYVELGDIIDTYYLNFHMNMNQEKEVNNLSVIIPDELTYFWHDYNYPVSGLYFDYEDAILVVWNRETNTGINFPSRKDILPSLPHELAHRLTGLIDHKDFPQSLDDATTRSRENIPIFNGDLSSYNGD